MPLCLVVQSGRGASGALFRCVSKSKSEFTSQGVRHFVNKEIKENHNIRICMKGK